MAQVDSDTQAHLDWLGFVQPHGLVVSAPALVRAGAILNRNDREGQELVRGCVEEREAGADGDVEPWLPDFESFARQVLGWGFLRRYSLNRTDPKMPSTSLPYRWPSTRRS